MSKIFDTFRLYLHVRVGDKWKFKGKTFAKYQDAVNEKVKLAAEVKVGSYIEPTSKTVKELLEKWLEAGKTKHGTWKIQTYLFAKTHVDNYIVPKLGGIKASALKKTAIETAGAEWQTQNKLSAETVNKIYGTLAAAFKWALRDPDSFGPRANPMNTVDRAVDDIDPESIEAQAFGELPDHGDDDPESKPGTLREIQPNEVYSALELKRIIAAANPGLEKVLLMTAVLTGLRHGELCALRWPMINLKKGKLRVNRSLTQLSKKHG